MSEKPDWTIKQTWQWFREKVLDDMEGKPSLIEFSYNSYMCGAKAMFEMMRGMAVQDDPVKILRGFDAELEEYQKRNKANATVVPPARGN